MTLLPASVLAALRRLASGCAGGWFRARLADVRCVSVRQDKSITLSREFLPTAAELEVEFTLEYPRLAFGRERPVSVRLFAPGGERLLPPDAWQMTECRARRARQVRVRLPAEPAASLGGFRLVINGPRHSSLTNFRALTPHEARNLVLQSLKVETPQLWIASGTHRHRGYLVAQTSDVLEPEFTLRGLELGAFLSGWAPGITLSLLSSGARQVLAKVPLPEEAGPVVIRGPAVPVKGTAAGLLPGQHSLVAAIGEREIVSFPFRVVSEKELRQQVSAAHLSLEAETAGGGIVCGLHSLHALEHRSLRASFQITTGILAPNSVCRVSVHTLLEGVLDQTDEFTVQLDRLAQPIALPRIELPKQGSHAATRPAVISIGVAIEGEQKTIFAIPILPGQRITNFEGQLTLDAEELPVDDAEYEEIIRGLLAPELTPPERKSWLRSFRSG